MVLVPGTQRGQEPGDVGLRDLAQGADAGRGQVPNIAAQVAAVGRDRVRREPALDRQVVQVAGDDPLEVTRRRIEGSRQDSTSSSATAVIPCASATSGRTTRPATTFTPWASAGLLCTAAVVPSLASAMT